MTILRKPSQNRRVGAILAVSLATGGLVAAGVSPASASVKVTHCPAAALKITPRDGGAGVSHHGLLLVLTNVSKQTCTVTGYPKVAILNARGKVVRHAEPTRAGYLGGIHGPIPVVRLAPGRSASALLEGVAIVVPSGVGCPTEQALRVTSPQTFRLVRVKAATDICTDVEVHPVVAGVREQS